MSCSSDLSSPRSIKRQYSSLGRNVVGGLQSLVLRHGRGNDHHASTLLSNNSMSLWPVMWQDRPTGGAERKGLLFGPMCMPPEGARRLLYPVIES